ncbi:Wzz/FepE/Etk N-terminal domain-containing protein [Gracilimonas tropica]|uniref:Wzz/FepE/Etk N-terminal domain-containing protein n=1 Tax=Gracilimonas tropica TaxID=454600 RepID=UPI00036E71D3|nr:Wzz/FepE/Etk N-terminal domain-containing protein [Gracilimonas tropica]
MDRQHVNEEQKHSDKGHGSDQPEKKKKKSGQEEFPLQEYRLVPVEEWEEDRIGEREIDLIELAKYIWENRVTIYKFVAVGVVLGLAVALLSPKEYVSDATLMPEYSTESQGSASSLLQQYGGLIGLSGGTYNSASNAIRVNLYPKIVSSLSFQKKIADQEFYFPEYDTTVSLMDYYLEVQSPGFFGYLRMFTIGLPGTIMNAVFSEEQEKSSLTQAAGENMIISLTKDEMEVIKYLREQISASLDEESGIVTVRARMGNPQVAAEVAKLTIDELTEYLTDYRTEKVLRDLEFIEEQLATARQRFREAQLALAEFDDSNKGNLTARASTERQRLQSEYDIAFNLYNSLSQQFEEAKLKVQEETPVFKVLQPVQVPVEDETSGAFIVIVCVMLGGILGLSFIFLKIFLLDTFKNYS